MKEKLNEKSLKIFVPPIFSSLLFALVCVCLSLYSASFQLQIIVHNKNTMTTPVAAVEDGWEEEVKSVVGQSSRSHAADICLHKKCAPPLSFPLFPPLHFCLYLCVNAPSTHHFPQTQQQQTTSVCHFERPSHNLLYVHRRLILPQVPQIHRGRSLWGQSEVKGQGLCSGW